MLSPLSQSYTLDGLDAVTTNLDELPFSLDSRVWEQRQQLLGGINTDLKLTFFDGAALDATIETGEFQLNPGMRTFVNTVRPYVDGTGTITMQISKRNLLSESASFQTTMTVNNS